MNKSKNVWLSWKKKWGVESDARMIWIFLIFSITGSSTVLIRKYLFSFLGLEFDNAILGFFIKLISIYLIYQILLFVLGSIMGEHKFVKWFVWKMNSRFIKKAKSE